MRCPSSIYYVWLYHQHTGISRIYKKSFEIKRIPKTPYTVKLNKNLHRGKQNMVKVFVVLYKL